MTRFLALLLVPAVGLSEVKLPGIFSDHMVVQREKAIAVWGWAAPRESVNVQMGGGTAVKTEQGEANHHEGNIYADKIRALIGGWRKLWNQGDFPFYFVQLAPFQYGTEDPSILPAFWEVQASCLTIPNSGTAVIHDIGNPQNIHPGNKQEVGRRLALIALAKDYGKKDLIHSGPVFKPLASEGNFLRVSFDHVGAGLASRDGKPLTFFEIKGAGTDYVQAEALIDGDTVKVSSPRVEKPMAVRFAWHKLAVPNLMNKAGLPAAPFRAGEPKE